MLSMFENLFQLFFLSMIINIIICHKSVHISFHCFRKVYVNDFINVEKALFVQHNVICKPTDELQSRHSSSQYKHPILFNKKAQKTYVLFYFEMKALQQLFSNQDSSKRIDLPLLTGCANLYVIFLVYTGCNISMICLEPVFWRGTSTLGRYVSLENLKSKFVKKDLFSRNSKYSQNFERGLFFVNLAKSQQRWVPLMGEPLIEDDAEVDDWLRRFLVLEGSSIFFYVCATGQDFNINKYWHIFLLKWLIHHHI